MNNQIKPQSPLWDDPTYVQETINAHFPKDWQNNPLDKSLVTQMRKEGQTDIQIAEAYRDQF